MVALGILMILQGFYGLWLRRKKSLYTQSWYLKFSILMGPTGLIAILAGWFTTEVGRQPWVVYGLQRTRDAVSAHGDLQMSISLICFFVVYSSVFGFGYYYMIRQIKQGPDAVDHEAHEMNTISGRI